MLPYVDSVFHNMFQTAQMDLAAKTAHKGRFPTTEEGDKLLSLPIGCDYRYKEFQNGTCTVEFYTYGNDGKPGGTGNNSDFSLRWRGDNKGIGCLRKLETPYRTQRRGCYFLPGTDKKECSSTAIITIKK